MKHTIVSRAKQANKIKGVIIDFLGGFSLQDFDCVEVGCGSGEISAIFADFVAQIWGIEIDTSNILRHRFTQYNNLAFSHADGARLPFNDASFDLVLFPQVYEHTTRQQEIFDEILRVLKPGGLCFFSGPNRYQITEPHYFLPFLSWLPHCWASNYLRLTRKGFIYDIYPRSYWKLKKLTKGFIRYDYTYKLIQNPESFGFEDRVENSVVKKIPTWMIKLLAPIYPNYNWILKKPYA
jgi:SAM-dependent methyltransferase